MVKGFNRSLSLSMNTTSKARATYHVRSVSLPSQSHPLISNLEEQIRAVRLSTTTGSDNSLACIQAGLSQIELLHTALVDFLNITDTKNVLRQRTVTTNILLDNLLCLIDSYGSMLSAVVTLKQQLFEVQSAFRRCDSTLLASSLKSQKKKEKELRRLVSSLRASMRSLLSECASDATEAEVLENLTESIYATSAVSVGIFNRVVAVSMAASTAAASRTSSTIGLFRRKSCKEDNGKVDCEKLGEMEECVRIVESGSEKVFRSLVNSRVTILNIQSELF